MKLMTKIVVSSVAIGGLFVGGNYLAQNVLENKVVSASNQEVLAESDENLNDVEAYLAAIGEKNVADYYVNERGFSSAALASFDKKFEYDTKKMLVKELTDEEKDYLEGLGMYHQYQDLPILEKNQKKDQKDYVASLEASLADTMAMGSEDDSETPIIKICQKYEVDPNGTVADLPIEAIVEISDALYEASSHPKD